MGGSGEGERDSDGPADKLLVFIAKERKAKGQPGVGLQYVKWRRGPNSWKATSTGSRLGFRKVSSYCKNGRENPARDPDSDDDLSRARW